MREREVDPLHTPGHAKCNLHCPPIMSTRRVLTIYIEAEQNGARETSQCIQQKYCQPTCQLSRHAMYVEQTTYHNMGNFEIYIRRIICWSGKTSKCNSRLIYWPPHEVDLYRWFNVLKTQSGNVLLPQYVMYYRVQYSSGEQSGEGIDRENKLGRAVGITLSVCTSESVL